MVSFCPSKSEKKLVTLDEDGHMHNMPTKTANSPGDLAAFLIVFQVFWCHVLCPQPFYNLTGTGCVRSYGGWKKLHPLYHP